MAKLAGVPQPVIDKAKQVLQGLESGAGAQAPSRRSDVPAENPPRRDGASSRLLEALSRIDVTTLTPIEAINKLYELKTLSEQQMEEGPAARAIRPPKQAAGLPRVPVCRKRRRARPARALFWGVSGGPARPFWANMCFCGAFRAAGAPGRRASLPPLLREPTPFAFDI